MDKKGMNTIDIAVKNISKTEESISNCIDKTSHKNGKPKQTIDFEILMQLPPFKAIVGVDAYGFT